MKIEGAVFSKGSAGFFFDDQLAIRGGLTRDGFRYAGEPVTPGFDRVRIPSECVSVQLVLEDGQVALGDCCAVQYSGAGGRDPVFLAGDYIPVMEETLGPRLAGIDAADFRANAPRFDRMEPPGAPRLHTAIRYGLSQALLDAAAKARRVTMAEVLAADYGLEIEPWPVRIFAQSGDERETNVDKMILKGADVLPHGLINDPVAKVGPGGQKLRDFVRWLRDRILELRPSDAYRPDIHLDVYGTLGVVFGTDAGRIVDFLADLVSDAGPFALRVEHPVDAGSRSGQVEAMGRIVGLVRERGLAVEIVADEWCNTLEDIELFAREGAAHMIQIKTPDLGSLTNTVEAVMLCREAGVKAYLGGSCTETDVSARASAHVALATGPYQMLAKPGMGFDEGYMIVRNELERARALLARKAGET